MISKATVADATALSQLINSVYRGESSKAGWTTEAILLSGTRTDQEAIKEMFLKPGAVILKYKDAAGILTGCVYLEMEKDSLYLGM